MASQRHCAAYAAWNSFINESTQPLPNNPVPLRQLSWQIHCFCHFLSGKYFVGTDSLGKPPLTSFV